MSLAKRILEGQKFLGFACKDCKEQYITQVEPAEKKCPACGGKLVKANPNKILQSKNSE